MKKNTAGQTIGVQMVSATDGSAFTGAVTCNYTIDGGTQTAGATVTHEGNGYHTMPVSAAISNGDQIGFTFTGTGAVPATVQVFTGFPQSVDNDVLASGSTGFAAIDTVVDTILSRVIGTIAAGTHNPASTAQLGALTDWLNGGRLDLLLDAIKAKTDPITFTVANEVDVNVKSWFDTAVTALESAVDIAIAVWDRILTGATHNIVNSAGRRLRQIEAAFVVASGTAQAGAASTITLATGASSTNDIYNGDRIIIVDGTGAGEHGLVIDYDGTTKIATMSKNWVITPDNTSEYDIVPADCDVETWNNNTVTGDGDWSSLATSVTNIVNRIGSFTGTGANTVLGFFQALMRSDATDPSDVGGTYTAANDSNEAIRDRGDIAWITGGGGGLTQILNVQQVLPPSVDLANTATSRLGLVLINSLDDLPTTAEINPGTISIDRKAIGGTSWSAVVTDAAMSEQAGMVFFDEVFDTGSGYAEGDSVRVTFKSVSITADSNTHEICDANGIIFQTEIRQTVGAGGGLTQQQVRDAMKLAPTAGAPIAESIDEKLDNIETATETTIPTQITDAFTEIKGPTWDTTDVLEAIHNNTLAINTSTAGLAGEAMRGTDGANTVVPDPAGTAGTLTSGSMNAIADHVLRRNQATARASSDGDTVTFRSLLGASSKLTNKVGIVGTNLLTRTEDDSTVFGTQAVTTDASADPIVDVDTT